MNKGRVTIPTNLDVVKETLEIMDEWGADAIRDCDGTEFPQELKDTRMQKSMQPIIQPEKIMNGRKQIRKKFSRCIL